MRAVPEKLGQHLARARGRVGAQRGLHAELGRDLERLEPWYQPVDLGHGLVARARDKSGLLYTPRGLDRGLGKWRTFVEPSLPVSLQGARVLEVGCNAGMLLVECLRAGAREAVGVEQDEHYFEQSQFVARALSRLQGSYVPLRTYQGSMEDVDYGLLGRFDIALLLNVIYHVGRTGRDRLSPDATLERQVRTVRGIASESEYLLFAANPLEDEGYGKGIASLRAIVDAAGLDVVDERRDDHSRGYMLVARAPYTRDPLETAPLSRLVSKYFLPPRLSAERDFVARHVEGRDVTDTRYERLRRGIDDWTAPGQAQLPPRLSRPPVYWVVPWSIKVRPEGSGASSAAYGATATAFKRLIDSILSGGYDAAREPIRAYKLVHPQHGAFYQYIDGNQRLGALAHVAERDGTDPSVRVHVEQVVRREALHDLPLARQLVENGQLARDDLERWFDNAFAFLGEERR